MQHRWRRALPGALAVGILTGACHDAPVAPRATATPASPVTAASVKTFSGASSDSLVQQVMTQWARLGHPEYGRAIDAWRQRHLGTARPTNLPNAPDARATPRSALLADGGETLTDVPKVLSHREALTFGSSQNGSMVPTVLDAEMTFTGDQGSIVVGSFTITSSSGRVYQAAGSLASGTGQLVYCSALAYGQCVNSRRLAGSMRLDNAPYCNANGSGNLIYTAQTIQSSSASTIIPGVTVNTGGNVENEFSISQQLNATAPSCAPQPAVDSTTSQPPGDGSGTWSDPAPDPYPADPAPAPSAPTSDPSSPKVGSCYSYFDPVTYSIQIVCSAN